MTSMKKALRGAASLVPRELQKWIIRASKYYKATNGFDHADFPSQVSTFKALRDSGWAPHCAIDVGAYRGEWTSMLKLIFPSVNVLMIEAQEDKRNSLGHVERCLGPGVTHEIALLGASDGAEVVFAQMETGSSVFQESSHIPRTLSTQRLVTLDKVLQKHGSFCESQLLKIDTQGYELEVLKGASCLLENLHAIMLEVSLLPVNSGCPLFGEVIAFMDAKGFQVYDFCGQVRRTDGALWQVDLLFVRKGGPICVCPELSPQTWIS